MPRYLNRSRVPEHIHFVLIYHACISILSIKQHTKLEMPSFTDSEYMTGAQNLKMRHITLTY